MAMQAIEMLKITRGTQIFIIHGAQPCTAMYLRHSAPSAISCAKGLPHICWVTKYMAHAVAELDHTRARIGMGSWSSECEPLLLRGSFIMDRLLQVEEFRNHKPGRTASMRLGHAARGRCRGKGRQRT